jgi:Fe(3+) dicitrate transport protein
MVNGTMNLTSNGAPGSQSNRINHAKAWALFFQDKIEWSRLALIPGLRYENIELIRTDFSKSDPNRTGGPTRNGKNHLDVFIPGVGITFDISDSFGLFGGIHKGFSPPGPGLNDDTEEEKSINYELGLRFDHRSLSLDVAGFVNNYSNLLGVDTLSSGGRGEGDLFNGGEARVMGLEMSGAFDLSQAVDFGFSNPIRFAYTLTDAKFRNSFESDFGPWNNVVAGDELPYLPRHQLEASFGLERKNWLTRLEAVYVSQMRTQAGQGPMIDSRATDSYLVFNLSGEYRLMEEKNRVALFLSLRNLTGEEYIVARRPAGARPGLPRTIMGGIKFYLGQ